MKEMMIYKNEQLHCIVPADRAGQALDALKKCFPENSWTLQNKPVMRLIDKIFWAVIGFIAGAVIGVVITFIELL